MKSLKQKFFYNLRKILNRNQTTINGISLHFPDSDDLLKKSLYSGNYELAESKILMSTLSSDDQVLEIGSSIGYLSILIAKELGDDKVIGVEANAKIIEYTRKNYENNGVKPKLINGLVSYNEEEIEFNVNENFWSSSVMKRSNTQETQKIKCVDIHYLFREYNPNFLVIDIEGFEIELLENTSFPPSVNKLLVEFHPHITGEETIQKSIETLKSQGLILDKDLSIKESLFFSRAK